MTDTTTAAPPAARMSLAAAIDIMADRFATARADATRLVIFNGLDCPEYQRAVRCRERRARALRRLLDALPRELGGLA